MKYVLLGAGLQGTAIAYDLLFQATGTTGLVIVDGQQESLDKLVEKLSDDRVSAVCTDIRDTTIMAPLMAAADVVISAVNYWYNYEMAALAVENRAHFLDLGGNNDIVAREFELDAQAKEMGVCVVPDCGLAPGLAGILGYWLVDSLAKAESLKLRVGGLPVNPLPPMNYKVVFAVQGLINEYIEPAVVIRDGKQKTVPSLSELEHLSFPAPFGELEAFQTSGGTSTLPKTLTGKIDNLDYKTIRYKGHCAQFRLLKDLGLCDSNPLDLRDVQVAPRKVLAALMDQKLDLPGEDVILLSAVAEGWDDNNEAIRKTIRIIDYYDQEQNISAMMRMTGYPAAIIAWMLASGTVDAVGALCQELIIPGDLMIEQLRARGVKIEEFNSQPGDPA